MEKKSPLLLRERVDWAMEQFPNKTSTNVPKIKNIKYYTEQG